MDQLRIILQSSNIDIFTLSETWLHSKIDNQLIEIQGYTTFRLDRCYCSQNNSTSAKRGGGLLTYVRTSSLDVYVQEATNTSTKDIEIQWLKVKRKNAKTITLANVFRPPTGKVNQAIKILEKGLNSLAKQNEEVVIIGDFNIDYKNQKSPAYKKIRFFERANSLEQKICTTTRNTKTSSSILDIAFTNMKYVQTAGSLDSFLSDHQPIFLLKKKQRARGAAEQNFEGRSYRNYNRQKFTDNLLAQRWNYFYEMQDPGEAWEEMQRIIVREADKQCPIRSYKIRNSKPCWLTNEIIEQMKDRDYFYQKAKRTNSEDDWNIAKFYRNQTNFNVRKAKADYIKEQLQNNEGNSAKFWRLIKQIMPNKKGITNHPKIAIVDENNEAIADENIADFMNDYFANLGDAKQSAKQNCPPSPPPPPPPQLNSLPYTDVNSEESSDHVTNQLHFLPVSKFEVEPLIKRINTSKSSGIAQLSSRLLKDSFHALCDKLTHLFNLSIKETIFPNQWKRALVVPIPKVPTPNTADKYRPISLLTSWKNFGKTYS